MPLESPVNEIADLNEAWPLNSDLQSFSDDHKRNVKKALKNSFSHMGANGGIVTVSAAELNHLAGSTGNVQDQLNAKSSEWFRVTGSAFFPTGRSRLLVDVQPGGTLISLPSAVADGTEIRVRPLSTGGIDPSDAIVVSRSGIDTIVNLDTGTTNLTTISITQSSQYWLFVFESRAGFPDEWLAWRIPREIF